MDEISLERYWLDGISPVYWRHSPILESEFAKECEVIGSFLVNVQRDV